jgi:hypothetical protein
LGGCEAAQNGVATAQNLVFCSAHFFAPPLAIFFLLLQILAASTGNLAAIQDRRLLWAASAFPKSTFWTVAVIGPTLRKYFVPLALHPYHPDISAEPLSEFWGKESL